MTASSASFVGGSPAAEEVPITAVTGTPMARPPTPAASDRSPWVGRHCCRSDGSINFKFLHRTPAGLGRGPVIAEDRTFLP